MKSAFALHPDASDSAHKTPAHSAWKTTPAEGSKRPVVTHAGTASRRTPAEVRGWVGSVPSFPAGIHLHHIKPLQLPKFNGEQRAYIPWQQRFLGLADDDTTVSQDYKMERLRENPVGGRVDS